MNCPACGHTNRQGANFCSGCGVSLAPICGSCGTELSVGAHFCDGCGEAVGVPSQAGRSPSQKRVPRDYTPKHLAEKILTSKSALEGERKQVTVLFADVKGSLDLAEQVDPEEWHRILNRFFEILSDGVHRFEGTVNQYTGDGIMALFGAPIAHEDHAQRACYAALHLNEELRGYARTLRLEQNLDFSVRMGLNSGEVIVGKIGDDLRMDYTAQGHTVGLAARMEQLAEAGKVYLTEHTAALVSGFFRMEELGQVEMKGVREPVRLYQLEGVGTLRTRLDVSRARGLTRFVGRADEMAALQKALSRAIGGDAQAVGVVSEAGVGKSRLCYEFVERCRARGTAVREAHGVAHGKSIPFLPVLELMRGFFGVAERDGDQEARQKIAGTLLLLDRELTESLPLLFEFLGVPDPKNPAPEMDPEARQRSLFVLVRRIVRSRSREEPAVLLFEDLHWFDGGSEAFLENLVEALPGTRTLLLVNFRPEFHAGWMQKSYYQQLSLLPLNASEIRDLLGHLLGTDPSLAGLAERIRERTGGNPFFIEEAVQSLVEAGLLEGARGAYRLSGPVEEVAIPATVQAVLAARIDRLAEREKHVLQTAAVVGKEFAEPVLKEVVALPDVDLADSLRVLAGAEFIYEASLYPELSYAFKHPLTQEVAYRSQLADRRARVHGAVAQAIAQLDPQRLDERAALLAHHWEAAGEKAQAARWHGRAGKWAGLRDPAETLRHWRRVRSLLEEVPESPETIGLDLMARIQILDFGWRLGLSEAEAARVFAEGKALAERSGNVLRLVNLMLTYTAVRLGAGQAAEVVDLAREAHRLAGQVGDAGLELNAGFALVACLFAQGRLREALAVMEKTLERAPDVTRLRPRGLGFMAHLRGLEYRAMILTLMGRPEEGLRDLNRCLQLAQEHGEMEIRGWVHADRAFVALLTGDPEGVLGQVRKSFEIAEKIGSSVSSVRAHQALGLAHELTGEWGEARKAFEAALTIARQSQAARFVEGRILASLGESYAGLGEGRLARDTVEEAVAIIRRRGWKVDEAEAHLARARVLLRTEGEKSRRAIEAALVEAMTAVQETGTRCWEPFIHEERAALARLLGDEATRDRELREAHHLFVEMGATGHAARLAKELGI